jgi:hypothetical protein
LDTHPDVRDSETGSTDVLLVLAGVGGMAVLLLVAEVLGIGHAH